MAHLEQQPATKGKRSGMKKASLKVDMTPMVDLGFLLITFFIFTSTLSEAKGTDLYMPATDKVTSNLGESDALTVLLGKDDRIYYYEGAWKEAIAHNQLHPTTYDVNNGLGRIIREKQSRMSTKKDGLMLLIKPFDSASYKNMVDVLDEVTINGIKRYAIMQPSKEEVAYLEGR